MVALKIICMCLYLGETTSEQSINRQTSVRSPQPLPSSLPVVWSGHAGVHCCGWGKGSPESGGGLELGRAQDQRGPGRGHWGEVPLPRHWHNCMMPQPRTVSRCIFFVFFFVHLLVQRLRSAGDVLICDVSQVGGGGWSSG